MQARVLDYEIMGTKNKAVTAYLPADIEASLAEYCLEQGLSRQGKKSGKEKPALGTGIVEVLRTFFGTETNGKGIKTEVDQKAIEAIVSKKLPSNVPTEDWVKTEIQQAIAGLRSELKPSTEKAKVVKTVAATNGKPSGNAKSNGNGKVVSASKAAGIFRSRKICPLIYPIEILTFRGSCGLRFASNAFKLYSIQRRIFCIKSYDHLK